MIKNYFKIALRSFLKDKAYSLINTSGLVIALAGVLMITAYVRYQMSFDKSYSNSDRIYRVVAERKKDSLYEKSFMMPDALAYTLKYEFPEVESVTKLLNPERDFNVNNKIIHLKYLEVDSSFFHIFNLPFISGDPKTSVKNNRSIVLTQTTAKKLFPNQSAMGKEVSYKNYHNIPVTYQVTGVIKDIPPNTHFHAEAIMADTRVQEALDWRGYSNSGVKYIMLKKGADVKALSKKIYSIYKKYHFPKDVKIIFQPVTSIHLHSHIKNEPFENSDIKYVYIFSFAALLILFIACINYINLATARSLQRIKEVGMRKVMGASKKQLAFQFITESVVLFLISLPLAFMIAWLFWPAFAILVDIKAENLVLLNWKYIIAIFSISLLAGIISGAYPAFFLARLKPASILKDYRKSLGLNLSIRRTLIVFQFVVSIALIISTIIVYQELNLLNNMNLGFNKNYLVTLPFQNFDGKASSFKNELQKGKDIVDVSFSGWNVNKGYSGSSSMSQPEDSLKDWNFAFITADSDFLKTMQTKLISGRNFSERDFSISASKDSLLQVAGRKHDRDAFMNILSSEPLIITRTTAENLELKQPVVGQKIQLSALQGTVIGEIADFKGISLLEKNPMVVIQGTKNPRFGNTYIRINSKNIPQTIGFIKDRWREFFPGKSFDFSFMDDQIAGLYKSQQRLAILFTAFAILGILISLMGLFSLVALISKQRTKEIGIRKVLGASVTEIVTLLSGSFVKLILIAFIIAVPAIFWAMKIWLQDFQYRIQISWWIFLIVGAGTLCFALLVVSAQAIRAATANPVESLRTE